MAKIIKLHEFALTRLNLAEYTYFSRQVLAYIVAVTAEKLHVGAELVAAYGENAGKLEDIVAQSRISDETEKIGEVDQQADALLVYLLGAFRNAKAAPFPKQKEAGLALYNATRPYKNITRLPQRQQVQEMRGLLIDLRKPDLAAHVTTLGLAATVDQISAVTDTYAALLESRAESQMLRELEASKEIRIRMDEQYEEIMATAFAFSIAAPADEITTFLNQVNKLVDDTKAAYNQRIAQAAANKKK